MKVVVLGASGNAGSALLRVLDAEPRVDDVVAVARRPPHDWHSPKTSWRSLDIATDPLGAIVPHNARLRFQAVHADDVADAYRRAIVGDARGAFNCAAEPILDGEALFHLRLSPMPPGWVDMAHAVPLMDSSRASVVLGWKPQRDAGNGRLRAPEFLTGIGARGPGSRG